MAKKIIICIMLIIVIIKIPYIIEDQKYGGVSKETRELVVSYLEETYDINCKVIESDLQHYTTGITGGLYMYHFTCEDEAGTKFKLSYSSHLDLAPNTADHLKFGQ
ncbi:MAG: hypothetical protein IJZ34_13210 [Lachnospiraceae bacterium]|nr:hypothetical protein [Lachnospiraceae bacterium]